MMDGSFSIPDNWFGYGIDFKGYAGIEKNIGLHESICFVCGEKFSRYPEHKYRREKDGHAIFFCSYHCLRTYDLHKKEMKQPESSLAPKRDTWNQTLDGCRKRVNDCREKLNIYEDQKRGLDEAGVKDKQEHERVRKAIKRWHIQYKYAKKMLNKFREESK